jgi:hypothetical protein
MNDAADEPLLPQTLQRGPGGRFQPDAAGQTKPPTPVTYAQSSGADLFPEFRWIARMARLIFDRVKAG